MTADIPSSMLASSIENKQDEKELGDAGVINSQESAITDDGQNGPSMGISGKDAEKMQLAVGDGVNVEKMQVDDLT